MRWLVLAIAALAGVLLQTGVAVAAPVLHLSGWKASAGKPETFTITRVGGNGPATVTFKTADGSAIAGPDYAATSLTIPWAKGQVSATVQVATFINSSKAGQNISFTASIVANGATSSATGLIVEPAAPPPPVQCPDGTTVPAGQTCPVPPPTVAWIAAPLKDGGYARCKASGGCRSITAPCPQGLTPPAVCSFPDIIAAAGDVQVYQWDGCSAATPCRYIGAFWPQGQYQVPNAGTEGWIDEWEGVAPGS